MKILRASAIPGTTTYDHFARLHIQSIHHGLLPDLGRGFLSRLYLEIERAPLSGVWTAVYSDTILGFLAGTGRIDKLYSTVLAKAWLPLIKHAAPSMIRMSVVRRLPAIVAYPFRRKAPRSPEHTGTSAELLAIAVEPNARRLGVGRRLIEAFEDALLTWELSGVYRVLTNAADPNSMTFYLNTGFAPQHTVKHHSLRLQVFTKEVGRDT